MYFSLYLVKVDIDIKIRACKGSCAKSFNYQVDTESYENIQKQLAQASSINLQSELETSPVKVLKMRILKDSTVPGHYKTLRLSETQDLNIFDAITRVEMTLEQPQAEAKGSSVEASHVSVGYGVGERPQGGKIVTSTYGKDSVGLGERPSSSIVHHTCTKTITKKIISGPGGPREEIVETMTSPDGSDCSHLQGLGREDIEGHGGTYNVRVTAHGGTGGLADFDSLFPDMGKFLTPGSGSTSSKVHTSYTSTSGADHGTGTGSFSSGTGHGTGSHSVSFGGSESFTDLREGEEDVFDFDPSRFPSRKVQSGSSAHSKTIVTSSSSSSTSFDKGGSTFETKSLKSRAVTELGGLQHDESGEDTPDFRARSLRTGGEKLGTSYTGTGIHPHDQK